jgi:hypothetical protein
MSWFSEHPWVAGEGIPLTAMRVYRVGPMRFVLLPSGPPPKDLLLEIRKRVPFVTGKSAFVAALEGGIEPSKVFHLAIAGMKGGLWDLWPEWNSPLWKLDMKHLPLLQERVY